MKMKIECEKAEKTVFGAIWDREYFYHGNMLCVKITQPKIKTSLMSKVNAMSIISAGWTYLRDDEPVYRVNKTISVDIKPQLEEIYHV